MAQTWNTQTYHENARFVSDLGMAVVDIFRVEEGKIVEHWDVTTDVPEQTASGNPIV